MHKDKLFKFSAIGIVALWLFLFALLPLLCIIIFSFLQHDANHFYIWKFTWQNYQQLLSLPYLNIFWHSVKLAFSVTIVCLILGYPFAYFLTKLSPKYKSLMALLIVIPFWTSSLLRSFAIITLIQANGIMNKVLLHLHIIHQPLQLMYTNLAVLIGLVYNLLPFVILPLFANMEKLDLRLLEAARDLGANQLTVFIRVLLPLTRSGIFSAVLLTFLPAMTLFYIPDLLGGAKSLLVGNVIQMTFLSARNWPMGAALGISLTLIMSLLLLYYLRSTPKHQREAL